MRQSPPVDEPPGEIVALFGPHCHLDLLKGGGDFLKKCPKRGYPLFWALFGDLGDFPAKTVCQMGLPGNASSRENGTPPLGGHLRGPPEGQFGP